MSDLKERSEEEKEGLRGGADDERLDDSDDSEAFADALDKLDPASSGDPVFAKEPKKVSATQDESQDEDDEDTSGISGVFVRKA